jgi:hypothetical protein
MAEAAAYGVGAAHGRVRVYIPGGVDQAVPGPRLQFLSHSTGQFQSNIKVNSSARLPSAHPLVNARIGTNSKLYWAQRRTGTMASRRP